MNKKFFLSTIFFLTVCLTISGCVTNKEIAKDHQMKLLKEGKPEVYANGYYDGCMSLYYSKTQKDVLLAVNNKLYKMGWQDGYQRCQHDAKRAQDAIYSSANIINSNVNNIGKY